MTNTNPEDKFYWTMKTELKLVKFLESKRYIWDPTHKQYSNAKSKEKVYVEFAERNGNKFTSQAVKERWISIRSTFSKYVRKIEASKHTDKIYKPCWRLWDACQFLYQVKLKYREDAKMRLRELIKPEPTEEDRILTALTSRVSSGDEDEAFQDEIINQNPTTAECQNIVNGITAAFKGVQHGVFGFDYNSIYGRVGKLITHRLSEMNSYEAALASKKIMEILLLYDERNPDNPNNLQLKKEY